MRIIDDFKESTGNIVHLTMLATAAAFALFITTAFLCAAAFMFVLEKYGAIEACLAGAAVFLVVALLAAGCYMLRKHQIKVKAEREARSAAHSLLTDPAMMAIGLQIVRAVGIKRLVPLLAIGGVGLVGTSTHFTGPIAKEMIEAFERGDTAAALTLHRRALPLFTGIFRSPGTMLVKAGLRARGLPAGPVRSPLVDASEHELDRLRRDAAEAGISL